MKRLLTGLIALSSFSTFAYELKEGKALAGLSHEQPKVIQISLQADAAELIYRKLEINEVRVMDLNGFEMFEKSGDSVSCTKIAVDGEEYGFDCKILLQSFGIAIKP